MNKKGSYFSLVLILFALAVGVMYTQLDEAGIDKQNLSDKLEISIRNVTNINFSVQVEGHKELGNAINYYVNGLVRAMGEVFIWVSNFVEETPEAPYKLLILGIILAIFAPLIYPIFIIVVSLILITKEYFTKKREKKENG